MEVKSRPRVPELIRGRVQIHTEASGPGVRALGRWSLASQPLPEHPVLSEPLHLSSILPGMLAPRPGQLPLARDYGPRWFPESRLDIPAVSVSLSPSRHFSTCSYLVSPPPCGLSKGGSCAAACPLLLTAPAKRLEYSTKDASIPVKTKQLMAFSGPLCNRLLQI